MVLKLDPNYQAKINAKFVNEKRVYDYFKNGENYIKINLKVKYLGSNPREAEYSKKFISNSENFNGGFLFELERFGAFCLYRNKYGATYEAPCP